MSDDETVLRAAINVLRRRESPDDDPGEWRLATEKRIDRFTLALRDHGLEGCPASPHEECASVAAAREVLAGQA